MSRARLIPSMLLLCLTMSAYGQTERHVSIVPERPQAGSGFVVSVTIPGESAQDIEAIEPGMLGPARYTGADVKPQALAGVGVASIIEYRFMTSGPGRIDIVDLSALSRGRRLHFGSWILEAVPGSTPAPKRLGYWKAPVSVLERQRFVISARDTDGLAIACPTFSVASALFEPIQGSPGAFYVVALEPGTMRLPALKSVDSDCELAEHSIEVKPLPSRASEARALGSDFSIELSLIDANKAIKSGEAISWDLRATGQAWPGLAMPPDLQIEGPDDSTRMILDGLAYAGQQAAGSFSFSGRRGTVVLREPGEYVLRPLAYHWLDTESGTLRQTLAQPVRIMVLSPEKEPWEPAEQLLDFTLARLHSLEASLGEWKPVLSAFELDDWISAGKLADELTGIGHERGSMLNASMAGYRTEAGILVLASLRLLVDTNDEDERAEAYALLLHDETLAFPARNISGTLDAVSASFGNLDRSHFVIPPPGYMGLAALACLIVLLMMVVMHRWKATRNSRGLSKGLLATVALVLVLVSLLAAASAIERASPHCVSLGAKARSVPSLLAAEGKFVPAGRSGRVLESAGAWIFVEIDAGEAYWLSASDVVLY
ncbi:MAG: hypothetical protein RBT62_03940 [Spirochaetia bacterium]|nr:hypothetical protein [Spirochaetia bacterium]